MKGPCVTSWLMWKMNNSVCHTELCRRIGIQNPLGKLRLIQIKPPLTQPLGFMTCSCNFIGNNKSVLVLWYSGMFLWLPILTYSSRMSCPSPPQFLSKWNLLRVLSSAKVDGKLGPPKWKVSRLGKLCLSGVIIIHKDAFQSQIEITGIGPWTFHLESICRSL